MALLYIAEYATLPKVGGEPMQVPAEPAVATQVLTYSTSATATLGAQTVYVAIISPGIFSYTVTGPNGTPTATTSHFRIPAETIWCFAVQPGSKIAAVTNT